MPTINSKVCVVNGTPVDKVFSNGKQVYGRNLLRNSRGKFQPNSGSIDNFEAFHDTNVYMEQGKKYTVSAQTAPGFVLSGTHDNTKESNRIVLWLMNPFWPANDNYRIISSDTTDASMGGTHFTWNLTSGMYVLRINSYKKDNSGYAEKIKIERGITATPWTPAPEDVGAVVQSA